MMRGLVGFTFFYKSMENSMKTAFFFAVGFALIFSSGGCKKSDDQGIGPNFSTDQDFLQYAATNQDSITDYTESIRYTLDDDGAQPLNYEEGFHKISETAFPIAPLRWGRRVTSVERNVSIDVQGDSIAIATIQRTLTGTLFILAIRDSGGVQDTVLVTKPFSDAATRKVQFVRVGRFSDLRRNWRPVAISLVSGSSSPPNDFSITELTLTTPRDTFTVTDPLSTWLRFGRMRGEIPRIRPNEPVHLRIAVTSQSDSAEFLMLRWGVGMGDGRRHRVRMNLTNQVGSPGAWTRVYDLTIMGHRHQGRFNAVVDGISYNSLFNDDPTMYSNKFWGIPYMAVPF